MEHSDALGVLDDDREAAPGPDPRRWFALAAIAAAQFMVVLDIAIVNVALPTIGDELEFSPENPQWVVSSYTIVFGGFLLLGGARRGPVVQAVLLLAAAVVAAVLIERRPRDAEPVLDREPVRVVV